VRATAPILTTGNDPASCEVDVKPASTKQTSMNKTKLSNEPKKAQSASTLTAPRQDEVLPRTTASRLTVQPFTSSGFPVPLLFSARHCGANLTHRRQPQDYSAFRPNPAT